MPRGGVFSNQKKKEEMLGLRMQGWSYPKLAQEYSVDHSTIIYHCRLAGVSLRVEAKKKLYELLNQGIEFTEISRQTGITESVIKYYLKNYGERGNRVFSRRCIDLDVEPKLPTLGLKIKKSKIKVQYRWWRKVRRVRPLLLKIPKYVSMKIPVMKAVSFSPIMGQVELETTPVLRRIDDRGVEWILDNKGEWICMGMSKEAMRAEFENRKKKSLELRRLQMLAY